MKKSIRRFGLIALAAVFGLILTGCLGLNFMSNSGSNVSIRTDQNVSTVRAGGTLACSASGQGLTWIVSSTSDGFGPVSEGTYITPNGVLTVSAYETLESLFVIVTSNEYGSSAFKQIRIVSVSGVSVSPQAQSVAIGKTIQFSAAVTGANNPDRAVTWKVSSNTAGTGAVTAGTNINANGLLTVAPNETLPTLYVTAASVIDPSKSGGTAVTIVVPTVTNVTVSAASQSVKAGSTLQFNASVTGTYNPATTVTWRVSSNAAGTGAVTPGTAISANGLLTAAANETLTTLYVIATSTVTPAKYSSVFVTVVRPTVTGVAVNPSNQSITTGSSLQFIASVTGANDPDPTVTWRVSSNAAGTGAVTSGTGINANGVLTVAANETAKTLFVFANSVFDPAKSGSVLVSVIVVTPTVTGVTARPTGQTVTAGKTLQFSATVTGTNNPDPAVTWKVSSNAAGTGAVTIGTGINANGLLTVAAGETLTSLYIFATSVADPSKTGSAAVTVNVPVTTPVPDPIPTTPSVPPSRPGPGPTPTTPSVPPSRPGPDPTPTTPSVPPSRPVPDPTPTTPSVPPSKPDPTPIPTTPTLPPAAINPAVSSVTVSPATISTLTNRTIQFSAAVAGTNNPNTAVTWRVSSNAAGTGDVANRTTISANGLLTVAPNEWATTLYVFAASVADPSKTGSAVVTITNNNENQGSNRGN